LATKNAGAVAFSRQGDPATGDFEPAEVLEKFGELPSDIAAFMGEPSCSQTEVNQPVTGLARGFSTKSALCRHSRAAVHVGIGETHRPG